MQASSRMTSTTLRRRSSSAEPIESIELIEGPGSPGPSLVGRPPTWCAYPWFMSTNDLYNRIIALRAIRSFQAIPLADDDLGRLLEAARWTGSSKNLQNWSFVVVDGPQKERLAGCGNFTDPLRNAPIAIALVEEPGGYEFDTGRVAQNLMLAADAIGVASCPITLHRDGDVATVLGLPDGARCRYAIALGYPAADAAPARFGGRKPMEEVAYHNRHGETG